MRMRLFIFLCIAWSLSGCSDDYPLIANGYGKTADLSALDNQGRGNFAQPIPPKSCLLAFKAMPDLSTMQIRAVVEGEADITYSSATLLAALGGQDFSTGIFVVSPAGVRFEKGYDCDSEIR
jgi:hypothetical protein